jgi:hypothetical protein
MKYAWLQIQKLKILSVLLPLRSWFCGTPDSSAKAMASKIVIFILGKGLNVSNDSWYGFSYILLASLIDFKEFLR